MNASDLLDAMLRNTPTLVPLDENIWPIFKEFVSDEGLLSVDAFKDIFGEHDIPVDIDSSSYSSSRSSMSMTTLLDLIVQGECIYGKDWHFLLPNQVQHGVEIPFEPPAGVKEDWLNWYFSNGSCQGRDDYRFIYIGGLGTKTALHHDVLCSYSWSANIVGRKLWKFWSPNDIAEYGDNLTEEVVRAHHVEPTLVWMQDPNQLMFVPSGWYHTVDNLGSGDSSVGCVTLSVNHNWLNGFNLYRVWQFMIKELINVREEMLRFLRKCEDGDKTMMSKREWDAHCEKVLKANCSFSLLDFFELICSRLLLVLRCKQKPDFASTERARIDLSILSWPELFCKVYHDSESVREHDYKWYLESVSIRFDTNTLFENYQPIFPIFGGIIGKANNLGYLPIHWSQSLLGTIFRMSVEFINIPEVGIIETYHIIEDCLQCGEILIHLSNSIQHNGFGDGLELDPQPSFNITAVLQEIQSTCISLLPL